MTTTLEAFDAAWRACKIPYNLAMRACNWKDKADKLHEVRTILCKHLQEQGYKLGTITAIMGAGDHTSVIHALRRDEPAKVPQEPSQHLIDAMRACGIASEWLPRILDWTKRSDVEARELRAELVVWLHERTNLSWPSIARALGASNHSCVMTAYQRKKGEQAT